jgi:GNAT superfamily N-acetyltransferase
VRKSRVPIEKGEPRLTLTDASDERAQAVVRGGLPEYNLGEAGYRDARPLAVLVSDPEDREVIGGLLGRTSMGLLFIDLFFLPESLRRNGIGSRVIRTAEDEALRRGAAGPSCLPSHFRLPAFTSVADIRRLAASNAIHPGTRGSV